MKIAFVTPAYAPAVIGAAGYCTELAEKFLQRGHEVKIFTPLIEGLKEKENIRGIEVRRVRKKQITESYYISAEMIKVILSEKFDVIHSHHYGYYPATAGMLSAKISKTPHVFGPYYHPPIYGRKKWLIFSLYHITQGLPILRFSDKVLPHTKFERNLLVKVGAKKENMELLPNIVDTEIFTPGRKEKIVLFVSSLLHEKGAHIALDMAAEILGRRKDVKFVFIGKAYSDEIKQKMQKLEGRGVKFLSNLTKRDLIHWYKKSSIFILPSKYEAFARVIAEAESCGCAIVATRVGGIPEVVMDKKSGYIVDYGNWTKMKEHIEYLLDNPKQAKKMGVAGRKHVKNNFDSKIVIDKLEKIYRDLV